MRSSPASENCEPWLPDRYALREAIYHGGTGTLYRLRDNTSGEDVVLKCFTSAMQGAYLREMAAAFGIRHPHVCHCLDTFYSAHGDACMVYEYLPDGSLRDWLQAATRFEREELLDCLRQLLEGLRHLHAQELIHCDLKPENVLVKQTPDQPRQYLITDLGAACYHREAREKRYITGSPAYVAPERVYTRFSYNSDLYSLGVMGFELAVGERPFQGDVEAIYRAHVGRPPPLERVEDPVLREYLGLLLEKDPAKRIASCEDALHILAQLARGETPLPPATRPRRIHWPAPRLIAATDTQQWVPAGTVTLPARPPVGFSLLHLEERPVAALHYERHTDLRVPPGRDVVRLVLHDGPIQAVAANKLAFIAGGQACCLDLGQRRQWCQQLVEHVGATAFAMDDEYLVCVGEHGGTIQSREHREATRFALEKCWQAPLVLLLSQGEFCCTGGLSNNEVHRFNVRGEPRGAWTLNGPVLGWTYFRGALLVLCMALLDRGSGYGLWILRPGEPPRQQALPEDLAHWCFSAGTLFWTNQEHRLFSCGEDATLVELGGLGSANGGIAVSRDQRFFAALTVSTQAVALRIWGNLSDTGNTS